MTTVFRPEWGGAFATNPRPWHSGESGADVRSHEPVLGNALPRFSKTSPRRARQPRDRHAWFRHARARDALAPSFRRGIPQSQRTAQRRDRGADPRSNHESLPPRPAHAGAANVGGGSDLILGHPPCNPSRPPTGPTAALFLPFEFSFPDPMSLQKFIEGHLHSFGLLLHVSPELPQGELGRGAKHCSNSIPLRYLAP